ncbi:unnamed protein product [Merluccius merluccius]
MGRWLESVLAVQHWREYLVEWMQDEFLVETDKRLRSEIAELCLANGSRAAVAAKTAASPPAGAPQGPGEDVVS